MRSASSLGAGRTFDEVVRTELASDVGQRLPRPLYAWTERCGRRRRGARGRTARATRWSLPASPSARYSRSGSALGFSKGRTATVTREGGGAPAGQAQELRARDATEATRPSATRAAVGPRRRVRWLRVDPAARPLARRRFRRRGCGQSRLDGSDEPVTFAGDGLDEVGASGPNHQAPGGSSGSPCGCRSRRRRRRPCPRALRVISSRDTSLARRATSRISRSMGCRSRRTELLALPAQVIGGDIEDEVAEPMHLAGRGLGHGRGRSPYDATSPVDSAS